MADQSNTTVERQAPDGELPLTIVTAVATTKNVDSTSLDPLYTAVNPEALKRLFRGSHRSTAR